MVRISVNGFPILQVAGGTRFEMRGNGSWDPKTKEDEEEEDEGNHKPDCEEIRKEEFFECGSSS